MCISCKVFNGTYNWLLVSFRDQFQCHHYPIQKNDTCAVQCAWNWLQARQYCPGRLYRVRPKQQLLPTCFMKAWYSSITCNNAVQPFMVVVVKTMMVMMIIFTNDDYEWYSRLMATVDGWQWRKISRRITKGHMKIVFLSCVKIMNNIAHFEEMIKYIWYKFLVVFIEAHCGRYICSI